VLATRLTDELRKDLNVLFQDKLFEEHKTSGETSAFQSNDLKKQPSIFYAGKYCCIKKLCVGRETPNTFGIFSAFRRKAEVGLKR